MTQDHEEQRNIPPDEPTPEVLKYIKDIEDTLASPDHLRHVCVILLTELKQTSGTLSWDAYQGFIKQYGMNNWEREACVPFMDGDCLIRCIDYCLSQCERKYRTGPCSTYDESVIHMWMPELLDRFRRLPSVTKRLEEIIEAHKCPCCKVQAGEPHLLGCDLAHCVLCGGQDNSCGCGGEPDTRPSSIWSGEINGKAECREYNMWVRPKLDADGKLCGWIPCSANTPEATEDLNKLRALGTWDKDKQRFFVAPERLTL